MRIAIIALEGLFDTGLTGIMDVFATANSISAETMSGATRFDVTVIGMRKTVKSALGLTIPTSHPLLDMRPDWVVVPALKTVTPETLLPALERRDVSDAVKKIADWHAQGARVAAACVGTYIVAEAGVLDGREATSTWSLAPLFRRRYPRVTLDETRMIVPTDVGVTAGAAMGHIDLAVWLVRQASPELASVVARFLLVDLRSSQASYVIPSHLARSDPLVQRFERWSRDHLSEGFSLQDAASDLATSARSLQRRCQAVLGKSPLAYFQDLRVEHARNLIQDGTLGLDAIASEVGYVDGATLRSLLRDRLGRGVRALRAELQ